MFGEVQTSLNAVRKAEQRHPTLSRLMRARIASLGLVIAFGFVLSVSLAVSAALTALMTLLHGIFPVLEAGLAVVDFTPSIVLISALYKVLPDTPIAWHDVVVGAICVTLLLAGGKSLIALYIGQSNIASSFGAAGALIVLLLWMFHSAQIFLLGASRSIHSD